jgi:hypothetical protein
LTTTVIPAPAGLRDAIAQLRIEATSRYGDALIDVTVTDVGLVGAVALPAQAEQLTQLVAELWPGARARLLVLATRRARVVLYPDSAPIDIWRRRPGKDPDGRQELTTQLLPGDPPAELLAVRDGQYLVRAPGEAVGWVPRSAHYRLGPPQLAPAPPQAGWDAKVVSQTALDLLGRPYVFGGTGGKGIDCSGLSWRAYFAAGVVLPRNSRAQRLVGERVRLAALREADIICAVHRGPKRTSHLALYLGDGEVVHACSEYGQVRREPLEEFRNRYQVLTVRRLPGAVGSAR